ncbi:MAG TPA: hypothetical protein VF062_02310 [Candidatus Limnocylindrales bacterium]
MTSSESASSESASSESAEQPVEPAFPLRLPAGWTGRHRIGAFSVAYERAVGTAILYTTSDSGIDTDDLVKNYDECLILDTSVERCRDGLAAQRVLTCYRQENRSLTAEHWAVSQDTTVHLFAAIMPTSRYRLLAPAVHRALRSFPSSGHASASIPDFQRFQGVRAVEFEVKVGSHPGRGEILIDHDRGRAAVLLPGMSSVRTVPAGLLPAWLAACAGLGPRPAPQRSGRLLAEPQTIERLLGGETVAAPGLWRATLSNVASSVQGRWLLGTTEIVDAGQAGLWRIDGGHEVRVLTATTATEVWGLLTSILAP